MSDHEEDVAKASDAVQNRIRQNQDTIAQLKDEVLRLSGEKQSLREEREAMAKTLQEMQDRLTIFEEYRDPSNRRTNRLNKVSPKPGTSAGLVCFSEEDDDEERQSPPTQGTADQPLQTNLSGASTLIPGLETLSTPFDPCRNNRRRTHSANGNYFSGLSRPKFNPSTGIQLTATTLPVAETSPDVHHSGFRRRTNRYEDEEEGEGRQSFAHNVLDSTIRHNQDYVNQVLTAANSSSSVYKTLQFDGNHPHTAQNVCGEH